MPPKSKTKSAAPKNIHRKVPEHKTHFLLGEKVVFWLLVMMTVALVTALFGNVDVKTLSRVKTTDEDPSAKQQAQNIKLTEELSWYQKAYSDIRDEQLAEDCYASEHKPANVTVTYSDDESGIRVQLPYNKAWGGEKCYIPAVVPYESKDAILALAFGRMAASHPIGAFRSSSIRALPPTSSTQLLNNIRIETKSQSDAENSFKISSKIINGIPVYRVEYTGNLNQTDTWYAAGRSYLFIIETTQNGITEDEATQIIQSLRVTK